MIDIDIKKEPQREQSRKFLASKYIIDIKEGINNFKK